jgi:hypothetical protein
MSINELAAVLTHRSSVYAFAIIAVMAGLAFMFRFTTFFGGAAP